MNPLALNTQGYLSCPVGLNTQGYVVCAAQEGTGKEKLSGGGSRFRGWLVPPGASEEEIRTAIRKADSERLSRDTDQAEVEYELPEHVNKVQPVLPSALPLDAFDSDLDRLLAIELRIAEMRRHALIERLYADEINRLEEELAVLLLTATL